MNAFFSRTSRVVAAIAALCMLGSVAACAGTSNSAPSQSASTSSADDNQPITVVASLNQWGSLASQIGGDDVQVTSILSSTNVDAHDFEPTTADVAKLEKADVVLVNGAGYDSWADKTLAKGAERISVADTVGAMTGDNPHLWFSKDARAAVAKALTDVYSRLRPSEKDTFTKNYNTWNSAEEQLTTTMKTFADKHGAMSYAATESLAYYLMSDLGFTDATPKGYAQSTSSEGEPAASDITDFQALLKDRKVSLLVNNSQEMNKTAEELTSLAESNSIPVLSVTEQMPSDRKTLTDWIMALVEQIEQDTQTDATKAEDGNGQSNNAPSSNSASPSDNDSSASSK